MHYRTAKEGEYTFKRDDLGVETVETQGLIIGTTEMMRLGPTVFLHGERSDREVELVHEALDRARSAGFWKMGRPAATMSPITVTVTV
jgi:hypothetical protein